MRIKKTQIAPRSAHWGTIYRLRRLKSCTEASSRAAKCQLRPLTLMPSLTLILSSSVQQCDYRHQTPDTSKFQRRVSINSQVQQHGNPESWPFQTSTMLDYIRYSLPYHLSIISLVAASTLSLLIVFVFIISSLKARREHGIVPKHLPWSGRQQEQILASIRANYRGLVDSVHLFKEGYRKVITILSHEASGWQTINSFRNWAKFTSYQLGRKALK